MGTINVLLLWLSVLPHDLDLQISRNMYILLCFSCQVYQEKVIVTVLNKKVLCEVLKVQFRQPLFIKLNSVTTNTLV